MPWRRSAETAAIAPYDKGTADTRPVRKLARSLSTMFKASVNHGNDNWTGTLLSPDQFITLRQPILVARSREQWSNNDYVRNYIRKVRQNVIGANGIKLQAKVKKPRGQLDADVNKGIEDAWCEWGKPGNCEVTGRLSLRAVQELCIETAARDGEFIVRKVYGVDAGPMGFALQLIDPQRLSIRYENYGYDRSGNFIRQGIEFNRFGKPIAYHFSSTDEYDSFYYTINGKGFVRVPAEDIIHGFRQEMVGQRRGLPWASTSLFRLHHLTGMEDAAVQNARAGATKMGFFEWDDGMGPDMEEGESIADTIDAEPLSFHELPAGAKFKEWNPTYPSGEFAVFVKQMLRGASAGMGVSYNNLAGDLEGVSYSSIRQGTLDERDHWMELQQWVIEQLMSPVYDAWLRIMLLSGQIKAKGRTVTADKLSDLKTVVWQGRRWTWVDPRADVDAAAAEVRLGSRSISSVIRESGRDPQEVFLEIAEDLKAMAEAGIPDDIIHLFMNGEPPAPPKPEPDEAKAA
ncbi:phage portal protein [Bradyrhizobium sp. 613_E4_N2_2]|uniref:phage portal protein n=1 Tax=Bradyrhizobium sp. 613_E4_N2_2 TaxID=3240371 RepID=UPI003F8B6515